jgi:hypothetical protein
MLICCMMSQGKLVILTKMDRILDTMIIVECLYPLYFVYVGAHHSVIDACVSYWLKSLTVTVQYKQ